MFNRLLKLATGRGAEAPLPAFTGKIPEGMRVYAVGDIHARVDLLSQLVGLMQKDAAGYRGKVKLVFIGDYIDRGPDSAATVDFLIHKLPSDWETVFLRGNHEQAMLDFLGDPKGMPMWLAWGGVQALESYGVAPFGARGVRDAGALAAEFRHELLARGHAEFYEATRLYEVIGGYLFAHAGVRPKVALENQIADDLLFIREDFLGRAHGLPYRVVFGHTILPKVLVEADRIGLDTGAFQSGVLTAVALEGESVRALQTA